jgi:alpha/beta hydrolase family protein
MHTRSVLRRAVAISLLAMAGGSSAATADTPVPTVSKPIAVTKASHPFGGAAFELRPENLKREGYVETEHLVSGKANVYTWTEPGPAKVRTPGAPYTTRILVRRPKRAKDFSGNVIVEMLNPSNLFDLNIGWAMAHKQIIRNGDAWIGITAKPIAVDALKSFDPKRYGKLSWANPLPLSDPANCETVPTDSSRTTENGLIWDINSQVGKWLKSNAKSNPLRGDVKRLYGYGYSQTGSFLTTYVNAIHPLDVRRNGAPIYDGYIIQVSGGATVINQCEPAIPVGDPRRIVRNAGVPVLKAMSQSDYLNARSSWREDSDAPADRHRYYEVAGAGHASPDELYYSARSEDIEQANRDVPPVACNEGPRSRLSMSLATNAMVRNLDQWVRRGIPAPHADLIKVENGQPVLDEHGNVIGGVRSPYVDVPTATWHGTATGPSFCRIAGWEEPFSQQKLQALYPTHEDYVGKVLTNVGQLVVGRFVALADGLELVDEANRADVP